MALTRRTSPFSCLSPLSYLELIDQRAWCLSDSIGAGVVVLWLCRRRWTRRTSCFWGFRPHTYLEWIDQRAWSLSGSIGAGVMVWWSRWRGWRRRRRWTRHMSCFWGFRSHTHLESIETRRHGTSLVRLGPALSRGCCVEGVRVDKSSRLQNQRVWDSLVHCTYH